MRSKTALFIFAILLFLDQSDGCWWRKKHKKKHSWPHHNHVPPAAPPPVYPPAPAPAPAPAPVPAPVPTPAPATIVPNFPTQYPQYPVYTPYPSVPSQERQQQSGIDTTVIIAIATTGAVVVIAALVVCFVVCRMRSNQNPPQHSREIDISKTTTEEFGYSDIDKKLPFDGYSDIDKKFPLDDDKKTSVEIWRVNVPPETKKVQITMK